MRRNTINKAINTVSNILVTLVEHVTHRWNLITFPYTSVVLNHVVSRGELQQIKIENYLLCISMLIIDNTCI